MAIELGAAYVSVIPEMAGVQREIGKALGDSSMGKGAGEAVGTAMSDGIVSKLKGIAKWVAGLAATKAVIDFGKAALDSYASYEQLVGGVDTLFKDASGQVQEFAANAYKTAGMSANEYMETVTGFSASLIASLDGDTEAAAKKADMAITDMSDNANKMGSSMESIQNAYQGFAKQNYTMLDNLKLGYGGTKEEMERLLKDAQAISGVEYDISSYADVVDAIHVIQTEMDITGTTAREAATTIEGSVGMMKAAWANWVTGIADEEADMSALTEQLVDAVITAASNVVPRIGVIAQGIASALPGLVHEALTALPDLVRATLGGAAADGLVEFMKPFMGLRLSIQAAAGPVQEAMAGMSERIQGHMADLQPCLEDVKAAVGRFADAFGYLLEQAAPVVAEIAGNLVSAAVGLAPILASVVAVVVDLASAITATLGGAIEFATWAFEEGIPAAVDFLTDKWDDLRQGVADMATAVKGKWDSLKASVSSIASAIHSAVSAKFDAIKSAVTSKVNAVKTTVTSTFNAIKSAITTPIEAAKSAVSTAIDGIKGLFNFSFSLPHIPLPHFAVTPSGWQIGDLLKGTVPSLGISWYARGGFFDEPTVLPGVGERGLELAWPGYEPYFSRYAEGLAEHMPDQGSQVVEWLERNLAPVIYQNVEHVTRREFARMAREAVRAGA